MEIRENKKVMINISMSDEEQIKKLLDILKNEEDYYMTFKRDIYWDIPILTGIIYVNPERKEEIITKIKKYIKNKE